MLCRPADRYLTLDEIADDWSREIQPPRSKNELATELCKAWWRGEFEATRGSTRLGMLQNCFRNRFADLHFWIEGASEPQTVWEQSDGGAVVDLTPILPIPSATPESWTDGECKAAYEIIAEYWGSHNFDIMGSLVAQGIFLSEPDFTKWIEKVGHTRPGFWAPSRPGVCSQPPTVKVALKSASRRGRSSVKRDAAMKKLRALLDDGQFTRDGINKMSDDELIYQTGAKRTTAREARARLLSE